MNLPASTIDCDVVLRDGSTLALRKPGEEDADTVLAFLRGLSSQSQYQRFLGTAKLDVDSARRLALVPPDIGVSLVGSCGGRTVALAGFYRTAPNADRAEVAFAIADELQGRGVGTRMLERLAQVAREQGIRVFDAFVLADNRRMLDVFADSGFGALSTIDRGVVHVTLSLDPTEAYVERSARRAQTAATASLRPFFEPRGVAVVGASRSRGRIGSEILHNLIASGFRGAVYPIHPSSDEIQGLRAYPRVATVPDPVDLAVIAVPADRVLGVVDDCIEKGVRGLCIITAGFGEAGEEGRAREAALVDKVRGAGCRLVGPNCMGLLNADPEVNLNATFSPVYPPSGSVAMSTQSGALGLAILDYARRLNIGISSFVSVGNKADVSGNDLLQYWAEDPRTAVILLYLESFGNPRKFSQIARRVGRSKPIVAVKAGRSTAGARAASSHTGALAVADAVVDALFHQAGVIRTGTLQELFDVAVLLSHQPLPRGDRVAILTNAGGPGILAADACEGLGLTIASLGEDTRRQLRDLLPASASVGNPVDMLASAPAEHYRQATRTILADEGVDSLIVIFIPPLITEPEAVAHAILDGSRPADDKPVLGVFMRAEGAPPVLAPIPCYPFPESAAMALSRVTAYSVWRQSPTEVVTAPAGLAAPEVRQVVQGALARTGDGWLSPDECDRLMAAVGIPTPASRTAGNGDEAASAARDLGFPVAVKALGPELLHKTERRAVILGLQNPRAVWEACLDLTTRLEGDVTGFLVQQMVPDGVEMLVGATLDPVFGHVVVCGSGGVLVDVFADSAVRLHPLTPSDAAGMVNGLKGVRLLRGYRGAPPADEEALRDVLLRVSALLDLCPEIVEMDINPLKVLASGASAVDVRIRVRREEPGPTTRRVAY
jgi:acetate---CoA ligase (ADP-forming)